MERCHDMLHKCCLQEGKITATSSRRRRSAQIRASEKSREYDRQREEIHPTPVLERLASLAPKPAPSLKLPPAIPNAEPDRPVKTLPVRRLREEP